MHAFALSKRCMYGTSFFFPSLSHFILDRLETFYKCIDVDATKDTYQYVHAQTTLYKISPHFKL